MSLNKNNENLAKSSESKIHTYINMRFVSFKVRVAHGFIRLHVMKLNTTLVFFLRNLKISQYSAK